MQRITIIENPALLPTYTIVGAPLILEFDNIFLRMPILPEGNVIFNTVDLEKWAKIVWQFE
jgi:hypothetical protein